MRTRIARVALNSALLWFTPPAGRSVWLFPGIPLALCVASLTAIGPTLQQVTFSGLNAKAPSLYAAAYQDRIATWPELSEWLLQPENVIFVGIGLIAVSLALRRETVRDVAISVGGWVATLLTIADVVVLLATSSSSTEPSMITNIAANAIGGALVSFIVFFALAFSRLLAGLSGPAACKPAQAGAIIAVGLTTVAAAHFVLLLLYQPLSLKMEAILRAPVSGWFSTETPAKSSASGSIAPLPDFSPIPAIWPVDDLSIVSPGGPLQLHWIPSRGVPRRLDVRFYTDCIFKGPDDLKAAPPTFSINPGQSMVLTVDVGGNFLGTKLASVEFKSKARPDLAMFALSRTDKGRTLEITRFDGPEQTVVTTFGAQSRAAISFPLFTANQKKLDRTPRVFSFSIGQMSFRVIFRPAGAFDKTAPQRCAPTPPLSEAHEKIGMRQPVVIDVMGAGVTVLLSQVTASDRDKLSLDEQGSILEIAGVNGWSTASGFGSDAPEAHTGMTRAITFAGAVSEFQVDGQVIPVRSYDTILAQGALAGDYISGDALRLHGTVDQLWRNGERLNKTRWEQMSSEWQVFLLSAFAALALAVWRVLWPPAVKVASDPIVSP